MKRVYKLRLAAKHIYFGELLATAFFENAWEKEQYQQKSTHLAQVHFLWVSSGNREELVTKKQQDRKQRVVKYEKLNDTIQNKKEGYS